MKIFVTGATGFIGTHLVKQLCEANHEVTALLRTEGKKRLLPETCKILKGDLGIFQNKNLELPAFDVVIHLAGVIFEKDRAGYMKYNYEAVKDLVSCLERQNWKPRRLLFASSLAASGPSRKDQVMTEVDTPKPIDHYGEAKWLAEQHVKEQTSFPTTSFRPAIVLGPGDENSLTLFKMAKLGLGITVDGKPQQISFVDVDDLIEAIFKMIGDTSDQHRTYFVAHPQPVSNQILFDTLKEVMDTRVLMIPLPKAIPTTYTSLSVFR